MGFLGKMRLQSRKKVDTRAFIRLIQLNTLNLSSKKKSLLKNKLFFFDKISLFFLNYFSNHRFGNDKRYSIAFSI
jgi:hypothetical protein